MLSLSGEVFCIDGTIAFLCSVSEKTPFLSEYRRRNTNISPSQLLTGVSFGSYKSSNAYKSFYFYKFFSFKDLKNFFIVQRMKWFPRYIGDRKETLIHRQHPLNGRYLVSKYIISFYDHFQPIQCSWFRLTSCHSKKKMSFTFDIYLWFIAIKYTIDNQKEKILFYPSRIEINELISKLYFLLIFVNIYIYLILYSPSLVRSEYLLQIDLDHRCH